VAQMAQAMRVTRMAQAAPAAEVAQGYTAGGRPAGAAVSEAVMAGRAEAHSRAAAWFWGATLTVIVWSVSYLLRQPGVAANSMVEPFSLLGSFAVEGMVLALVWLGLLATACLALLSGVARFEDPSA
jgi:hypothetical protein